MSGQFVISLDFELLRGVRDHSDKQIYELNVLRARHAFPLKLFAARCIGATWSTAGFLFCEYKDELLAAVSGGRPAYTNLHLSNYTYLDEGGKDHASDSCCFAAPSVEAICEAPEAELGTRTMSHYCWLENGQPFEADRAAAKRLADGRGVSLNSIVLPNNRFTVPHLEIRAWQRVTDFRGNPDGWAFRGAKVSEQTLAKRALRLIDAYSGALPRATLTSRLPCPFPGLRTTALCVRLILRRCQNLCALSGTGLAPHARRRRRGRLTVSELVRQRHRVSREIVVRMRSKEPYPEMRNFTCTF